MQSNVKQKRNEFFAKRFAELFEEKWKSEGGTQESFARAINAVRNINYGGCTHTLVSRWKNGTTFPETYLPDIAKVLDVDESEFFPKEHDDKYKSSSEYMTEVGNDMREYAEEIGLSVPFLQVLRSMGDFKEEFPFFCPIVEKMNILSLDEYVRLSESNASDSAPMTGDELPVFQFEKDDKTLTLSVVDLEFLKDVQDKVSEYVSFLYFQRKKEADEELRKLNEDAVERVGTMTAFKGFSYSKRNKYDKYFARAWERKHTEEGVENG